jgi:hypothetical protein
MRKTAFTLLVLSACLASAASATTISQKLGQSYKVNLKATPSGCENNPGPYITLDGDLTLGGIGARIILSNNAKGTHTASSDVVSDVTLIPAGEKFQIAKQPSRGGVGGNPWIYFQFLDAQGGSLGAPIKLGRCVQGLTNASGVFSVLTGATVDVSSGDCTNSGGPFITLSGELKLGGLNGRLILTNNAKFTHVASDDVVIDLVLLPDGKSITFAKQPSRGGAGGNPWIYLQFTDGSGSSITAPIRIGRCNQGF